MDDYRDVKLEPRRSCDIVLTLTRAHNTHSYWSFSEDDRVSQSRCMSSCSRVVISYVLSSSSRRNAPVLECVNSVE